jgi:hypothetical protein
MKSQLLFFTVLTMVTLSCSRFEDKKRNISSVLPPIDRDLAKAASYWRKLVEGEYLTHKRCQPLLTEAYTKLYSVKNDHFSTRKAKAKADQIIHDLWRARLALREKLRTFSRDGQLTKDCVDAVRHAFRASRYVEDQVGWFKYVGAYGTEGDPKPAFKQKAPYTLMNPKFKGLKFPRDFKSGDVIMWRGTTSISGSISRIGEVDGNFSHLSIVYIDPKTKKSYNIETLIETGSIITPLKKAFKDDTSKNVIFRYPDPKLAHKAAEYIYKRARNYQKKHKRGIPYDFEFNSEDDSELFCSELIGVAYQAASGGSIRMPLFTTQFGLKKNPQFLRDLGTTAKEGFQPVDMDIDHRFDMITEWRDYNRVVLNHIVDVTHTKMYEWMEQYGFHFQPDAEAFAGSRLALLIRRSPILGELLKGKVPDDIPAKTLQTVVTMHFTSMAIQKYLHEKNRKFLRSKRRPMTIKELYRTADLFLIEELTALYNEDPLDGDNRFPNTKFIKRLGPGEQPKWKYKVLIKKLRKKVHRQP